jgi:hypothetical protein
MKIERFKFFFLAATTLSGGGGRWHGDCLNWVLEVVVFFPTTLLAVMSWRWWGLILFLPASTIFRLEELFLDSDGPGNFDSSLEVSV